MYRRQGPKKKDDQAEEIDGYRNPEDKTTIDFAWILYVGAASGLSRKETGQLTFDEWGRLSNQFKRMHNMSVKRLVFTGV